jgi:uncharacterized membrane protein YfcA
MTETTITRTAVVIIAFFLHAVAIYVILGKLRESIIEILRDSLNGSENTAKTTAVTASLGGILILAFSVIFRLTMTFLTNLMLNESRPVSIGIIPYIMFSAIFLIIFAPALWLHHYEITYPKKRERQKRIVESAN